MRKTAFSKRDVRIWYFLNLIALSLILTTITTASGTTVCEIEGSSCTYSVTCIYHAGSASNPSCGGEPNVTFIITSSVAPVLTTSFFGATNFDSRVRSIIATNNSWVSLGPLAFRYYSKSKNIDLSRNSITEIQDDAFKSLVPLQSLNLSNNLIRELNSRSLLITESKSTDMKTLDLSYNILSHLSDEVLSHLPNLIKLYLQGNKLKTLADNCFGALKYLSNLQLQHNEIQRLNMSLINLKMLQYLDLSYNHLIKISGYETNRLQMLEYVNISHNFVESIESNCFVQSLNLNTVDLSFNSIRSTIENVMWAGNVKLKYLDLYNNHINGIERNSFKHNRLIYLNLENNNVSGNIKDNTFAGLEEIAKLDLSRQNISSLSNGAFSNMKGLINLNISRNYISKVEENTFINSSVSVLDLSYNNISQLNFLKDCLMNLTELYLNNNNLTLLYKHIFEKQTLIKKLDLSGNNILVIEENSLPLQQLQYFNVLNNNITGTLRSNMFSPAKLLRFLELSHFNINKIDNLTFVDMPVLARLNISHNIIEYIDTDNFKGMPNLYSLDVSYNMLKDIQFNNSLLTSLKAAYLNNNKLSNLSRIFASTCNILYLDISHNSITDLSNIDAKLFPDLQVFHLSHNDIVHFNNPRTNTLINLTDLGLSSNKITEIDLSYFKQLMIVDLSKNNLRVINNTFFKNIDFVQSMDLSCNNITDLPPGTFQNMKNLKVLNLSSNYITKLRYGSLKGLHKTERLDVSNNKIDSLDVHIFHECTELKILIIDYNRIKTLDIERLVLMTQRKLKTLSLGGNPISCQEIIRNSTLMDLSFYGIYQIEVTSIHKIYHEDNVHGIKCGDDNFTTTLKAEEPLNIIGDNSSSSDMVTIIWCSILTAVVISFGLILYLKMRKRSGGEVFYRDSRVHLRNSLELDCPEYNVIN